jgi:hypothetical protein
MIRDKSNVQDISEEFFIVAYLCFICASPRSTASTHSYKMKYQEYKGLYYNAWSTNNIVLLQIKDTMPQTYYNSRKTTK